MVRVERTTPMVSTGAHFAQRREPLRGAPWMVSRVDSGRLQKRRRWTMNRLFCGKGQELAEEPGNYMCMHMCMWDLWVVFAESTGAKPGGEQ